MKFFYSIFIFFSVFILSLLLLFYQNTTDLLKQKSSKNNFTIYMDPMTSQEGVDQLVSDIQATVKAEKVTVVSSEGLLKEFKKSFGFYTEGLFDEAEIVELLPKTVEVEVKSETDMAVVASTLQSLQSVEDVVFGGEWFAKLEKFDRLLTNLIRVIFLFVFLVVSFLTVSTVRTLVFSAKDEIEIYSLLGATRKSIYSKYVFNLSYHVVFSMLAGFGLSYLAFFVAQKKFLFNESFSFLAERLHFLNSGNLTVIAAGIGFSFVLGVLMSVRAITNAVFLNDGQ